MFDFYLRSEEHTSELQSQSTISYAVFCLKKKKNTHSSLPCYKKNIRLLSDSTKVPLTKIENDNCYCPS